jgi:phosphohistidine swiveling domain-containing protein
MPADAARVAAIVATFRGALGDELVLPWAVGLGGPIEAAPVAVDDVEAAVAEARSRAAALTSSVWRASDGRPSADAAARDLRGGAVERGLARIAGIAGPDAGEARRIVGLLRGVGAALEARGVLPAADVVWQLTPDELDAAVAGVASASHAGPDRWEAFLVEAALALGSIREGVPIVDGVGAGRLHVVTSLRDIGRPGPRAVLAAPVPLPQLAPLLWHCAGFVASGGSAGAHLFEVAHSLGVPAVVGVAPDELGAPGSLVAVDGTAGIVASLGGDVEARRPA